MKPIIRHGSRRLSAGIWGTGRSIWETECGERPVTVDRLRISRSTASERLRRVFGLAEAEEVCIRSRRYSVDGEPVMTAVSYLPLSLVAGSAILLADPGPGGSYARLRELGLAPMHFREELRSRMPSPEESAALELSVGTPVITVARTAFTADDRAVEINEMTLDASAYVLQYDFEV